MKLSTCKNITINKLKTYPYYAIFISTKYKGYQFMSNIINLYNNEDSKKQTLQLGLNIFNLKFFNQQNIINIDTTHLSIICEQLSEYGFKDIILRSDSIQIKLDSENLYVFPAALTKIFDGIIQGKI